MTVKSGVNTTEGAQEQLACRNCGEDVWVDVNGVSHHWGNGIDNIDHDADADHVAVPDA